MDTKNLFTDEVIEMPTEIEFGGTQFLLSWPEQFDIPELGGATFLTVFEFTEKGPVQRKWVENIVAEYCELDDVFQPDFLKAVLFYHIGEERLIITEDAVAFLHEQGAVTITTRQAVGNERRICPGPYHYLPGSLRSVWRLYEDTHDAFLQATILDRSGEPYKIQTAGPTPQTLKIAVPTRIQGKDSSSCAPGQFLRGWRIAVKDNFQIQHLRTSACNRAYYELYPPAQKTAACIQRLYQIGATVVGTTKLASFAATEEPMECIDWPAPSNPRADGYQSPAGSSSGSGAAIAAYAWLDITVGSDTSGSGRRPGHWNGCFAMRPSHGYLSHEGLLKSFPRFDVPTLFGRELQKCRKFVAAWYGELLPEQLHIDSSPVSVVYATDYMKVIGDGKQLDLIKAFVGDLEVILGIKHKQVSFEEAWEANPPSEANGESLSVYMKDVSRNSFFYEDYHNFDTFRSDYRNRFMRDAYISPPVRWQWELSSHITVEAHAEAMHRLEVYKNWFNEFIMGLRNETTLVLIPIEKIAPRYRDEMPTSHFNPVGVPNLFLSPILKAPELTVPIGEMSFNSKVSGNEERLPVAVSIIGPPGQDLYLIDLIAKVLRASGRPNCVLPDRVLSDRNVEVHRMAHSTLAPDNAQEGRPASTRSRSGSTQYSAPEHDRYTASISTYAKQRSASLYVGVHYSRLASFLRRPYENPSRHSPSYRPTPSSDFATLYRIHSDGRLQLIELASPLHLGQYTESNVNNILFMRGQPCPQWLVHAGVACRIDPEFFSRNLDFLSSRMYFAQPSLVSTSQNVIQFTYMTIGERSGHFGDHNRLDVDDLRHSAKQDMLEYFNDLAKRVDRSASRSESMVRAYHVLDRKHFAIEQQVSICFQQLDKGWTVVVWLDTGKPLSPDQPGPWSKALKENQRTRSETFLPWIQSHPFAALDAASLSIAPDRRPKQEMEQSASLLHLDYGKTLDKHIMSQDPFYALHELLKSFAYSEAQFLNVIDSKINEDIAKEFTPDHNISPANMIYFQGLLDRHAERLLGNIATIEARDESAWPQPSDEKMIKKTAAQAQALLKDYKGLLKRTETLSNTCKARLQILMSRAGIVESNKAIEQAKVVTKLTRLAFVFIPLSFVSSFFGMNLTPLIEPPGLSLWLFFAVSVPVVALLLLSMYCDFGHVAKDFRSGGIQRKKNVMDKLGELD
ncbi:hypothetical protein OPT61_g6474 [Boeremia exigua]|uniref:Uncharacterized protein n=1 Tax=Boeremia exigua TaxID=749465 RepID=A0ACC2I6H7_9PLEO|nr:hypothetical protein OPT61_g6474 [Boeremia exigua]